MIHQRLRPGRAARAALVGLSLLLAGRYAAGPMFRTAAEDRGVVAAGHAVQRLAAPGEPVVTLHGSTIDLLYYCDRPGWAIDPASARRAERIEDCRRQGARLAVIAGREPLVALEAEPLQSGPGWAIYRLAR